MRHESKQPEIRKRRYGPLDFGMLMYDILILTVFHAHYLTTQQNVFWKLNHADPYAALSFGCLHTFPGGLFQHLWKRIKDFLDTQSTRNERAAIDEMYVPYVFS
jgi:hypothetical protein